MKEKILIVEDEEDIAELVKYNLGREGYQVEWIESGKAVFDKVTEWQPDLILLDLMLPDLDGLEVAKRLKMDAKTSNIPIVMLTAKGEDSDIIVGLEVGADEYVTKPFSPKVLIARIRAVLRRGKPPLNNDDLSVITIENLIIDPNQYKVVLKGKTLDLTLTEFRILSTLARRPGWVFTRYQLIEAARGEDYLVTDRTIDVHIVSLRKKLGGYGKYIETIRGVGYRFKEQSD